MRSVFKGLIVVCAATLLSGSAYGADLPSFNNRGSGEKEEKAFAGKVAQTIVDEARSSAKDVMLKEYKFKEPKEGRKELHMTAGYTGAVTGTKYSADIVVHLDTSTRGKWEVMRIEYKDDNKSLVKFSQKKVDALVDKFNATK
jgi:hypothetical protein